MAVSSSAGSLAKVLIANRGEIACRVIRTCRRVGVETVAVFSDADRSAMHVAMADEAYHVGAAPAAESYLMAERILDVATSASADGIHPGYGFLSENEGFAKSCADRGVTFIGPPVDAIRAMGSKSTSKRIMIDAAVPVTPGYHGDDQSPERLLAEAKEIRFPVLIKATLGGGGKGMRLVEREEDFLSALDACKREAMKSFNDDSVLLERFVTKPRHVEFQIFADAHGNAVHLFERDCSVQRRHQKVLEESPAPLLDPEIRNSMGEAAVNAAKAVGYMGAGTVEFLLDSNTNEYFFCEMNTRLQVEHPVTELVTGLDLVEWQLRIAAGEQLPIVDQGEIADRVAALGRHAIEARVYAENPLTGFLPATGKLHRLVEPTSPTPEDVTVRVDTGIRQGDEVTVFYDPMISKLIVSADSRSKALEELCRALRNYQVSGLPTNLSFLQRVASHPAFQEGGVTTAFLDQYGEAILAEERSTAPPHTVAIAAVAMAVQEQAQFATLGSRKDAFQAGVSRGFRAYGDVAKRVVLREPAVAGEEGRELPVGIVQHHEPNVFTVDVPQDEGTQAKSVQVQVLDMSSDGRLTLLLDGSMRFTVDTCLHESSEGTQVQLFSVGDSRALGDSHTYVLTRPAQTFGAQGANAGSGAPFVKAPMPGKIVRVHVKEGDTVEAGQALLIMEAMKMEHVLTAQVDGVVESLPFAEGNIVDDGVTLVKLQVHD
mmetsp:Transcript_19648/g.57328  ORF Transcript_19648/g.57328 Transcript_19648/m.57328 type:complete len:715 (-) Transcript_19648:653-2797(-)